MDIDPQPLAPLPQSRKRAASSPSPAPDAVPGAEYGSSEHDAGHAAVRARVTSELDTLGVIPRDEAWQLHLAQVLEVEDGRAGDGLTLLCVGERKEALELLRATCPALQAICPVLQTFILSASKPQTPGSRSVSITTIYQSNPLNDHAPSISVPTISPSSPSRTFTRLGLLHPLGGGRGPLDAIVLLDRQGRRRLVMPFGWGAGQHVRDGAGGWIVLERLAEILMKAVGELEMEWMEEIEERYRGVMAA